MAGPFLAGFGARLRGADEPDWARRVMRWAQLVFVEDDPGRYDPAFWLDYFKRIHADGACLAGGGYMAFYPTQVPFHHRSKFLGDSDPFGELVKGCRAQGMTVIARVDPHATHQDVYEAHPEWIAVTADGKLRRHWANPEKWVTCGLGPYNTEFLGPVVREIVEKYGVDGIFANRWDGSGMCYCQHCHQQFRAAAGRELPRGKEPGDPAYAAYVEWRQQRLLAIWDALDGIIRKANPQARFIGNVSAAHSTEINIKRCADRAPLLFSDRQARSGATPVWASGKNAKEYRGALGDGKPAGGIFSVGLEDSHRWKDSVQDAPELQAWMVNGIAHGLRPWLAKFNAKPIDRRWFGPVEEVYRWHHANEAYLRPERSLARVALVYSQQTRWLYGGETAQARVEDHLLGYYQALLEARLPFDMLHDERLDAAVGRYRTLILPNIAVLSDQQCAQLRAFVGQGGRLVATYETSLYDEHGQPRPDFGLASLFGCSYAGRTERRMQNSYLWLESPPLGRHTLLAGLDAATRVVNAVGRVHVKPHRPAMSPLTLVPSYPDLPMEDVYQRGPQTAREPQVFVREQGKGRVVYFPGDLDRTFWEVLHRDHALLLANAVRWATAEPAAVEVDGPGLVDIAAWRQRNALTVHLVNLTNPMLMRGAFREAVPVGEQRVRLALPAGAKAGEVKLLVGGGSPQSRRDGNTLEVTVPSLRLHEVVTVDLS